MKVLPRRLSFLGGALCLCSGAAWAEPLPVTLQQAVSLAIRQNPALGAAGAALSAAEGSVLAAQGLDDPVLAASSEYRLRRVRVLDTSLTAPPSDEVAATVQLRQPLPAGGQIALGLETSYLRAAAAPALPAAPGEWTPALQLSLTQPLLRGFGRAVARAEHRRSSSGRDLAGAERAGIATALLRDVVRGYWRLVHAHRELEIRRASAAAARAQLERVHANIGVGKLPPSASAEIEVVIALRDDAVLLAEQGLTESESVLAQLCGVDPGDRLWPSEPLPTIDLAAPAAPALGETLRAALAHSPQLRTARAQGRVAAVELAVSENGLLPQLDLSLAGGPLGSGTNAGAAYEQLARFGGYALFARLAMELPLVQRKARGALEQARGRSRAAQLDETDVAAQIRTAVTSAIGLLQTAQRRASILVPSQRAAALDLEAEQARFEAGRASNFDVLRRQDALAAVQLLLLSTELQRLEARAALDALTGELLTRHGSTLGAAEP